MKIIYPALLSILLLFAACEKDDDKAETTGPGLANGLYRGTFSRTGMDTVNVSISVLDGHFEGESARQQYPAICGGSFIRDNGNIVFEDSCTWQANFDWTLILDGNYQVSENGNDVRIWRGSGSYTDEYLLTRQSR